MKVGIVGFGHIGEYMYDFINQNKEEHDLQVAFVWNRTSEKLHHLPKNLILKDLNDVKKMCPDLIVEVAHPSITEQFGELFLSVCNFMVGSPSILSKQTVTDQLYEAARKFGTSLYIPSGALWGASDIQKMASVNSLKGLKITMSKHPTSFKLVGAIKKINDKVIESLDTSNKAVELFKGSVRELCEVAPVNVNTMAVASIAASNLGFDKVVGCIISDPALQNWHVINIEVIGLTDELGNTFVTSTTRKNPALPGAVTGKTTLTSICSSLLLARGKGVGVHLC